MNKLKLFIENFLVYGLGGIISKIIPLIMVPVITRMMPNSEYYGISDLANTVISFGSALAVMGMYDAMYRMFFEKDDEEFKKDICSTALLFTIGSSIVIFFVMILFRNIIALYAFGDSKYYYLVYITAMATLVGATNSIVSAPTRMQSQRKIFLIMNTVSPILSYGVAIPLLIAGYYIIALPVATVIASFSSEVVFFVLNKKWFKIGKFKKEYLKPLLTIAVPLLPNFLIYWLFNSCDKLMIVNLIGAGASGIYTVGSKLGHCSQLIYTAFAGGWQFFAFSTMKEENQVENNSKVFEYLGVISFVCTVFVFAWSKPIFELLFDGEYVSGYITAPYLFLAPLLQMLFQVGANQFLVVKKTWPNLPILMSGAIVNILLNFVLIPMIGIEGVAIATLVGYVVSVLICVIVLVRMKLHKNSIRFCGAVVITIVFILIWRFITKDSIVISTILAIICAMIYLYLYKKDIQKMISSAKNSRRL